MAMDRYAGATNGVAETGMVTVLRDVDVLAPSPVDTAAPQHDSEDWDLPVSSDSGGEPATGLITQQPQLGHGDEELHVAAQVGGMDSPEHAGALPSGRKPRGAGQDDQDPVGSDAALPWRVRDAAAPQRDLMQELDEAKRTTAKQRELELEAQLDDHVQFAECDAASEQSLVHPPLTTMIA